MSEMDQEQFTEACKALASAWDNISESGDVFGLMKEGDGKCSVQMNWETMCRLFPDTRIAFVGRTCKNYPWEALIDVEGVMVFALLVNEQKYAALEKEDAALSEEAE